MAISNQKQAEKFLKRMQGSYARLTSPKLDQEKMLTLKSHIDELAGKVGLGDNTDWQKYFPAFETSKRLCLNLIDSPPNIPGIGLIAVNLKNILSMAWAIQLMSDETADKICAEIWSLCGEIAADLQD